MNVLQSMITPTAGNDAVAQSAKSNSSRALTPRNVPQKQATNAKTTGQPVAGGTESQRQIAQGAVDQVASDFAKAAGQALQANRFDAISIALTGKAFDALDGLGQKALLKLVNDIATGKITPHILVAASQTPGQTQMAKASVPSHVNGAFVPEQGGKSGTILLNENTVNAGGAPLKDIVAEEFGKAIATRFQFYLNNSSETKTALTADAPGHRLAKTFTSVVKITDPAMKSGNFPRPKPQTGTFSAGMPFHNANVFTQIDPLQTTAARNGVIASKTGAAEFGEADKAPAETVRSQPSRIEGGADPQKANTSVASTVVQTALAEAGRKANEAGNWDALSQALTGKNFNALDGAGQMAVLRTNSDMAKGNIAPNIRIAQDAATADPAKGDDVVPSNVNGAFVKGAGGKPGTIMINEKIAQEGGAALVNTLGEEYSEAVANRFQQHLANGPNSTTRLAPGDAGARVSANAMSTVMGDAPAVTSENTPEAFKDHASDTATVTLNGQEVEAKAETEGQRQQRLLLRQQELTGQSLTNNFDENGNNLNAPKIERSPANWWDVAKSIGEGYGLDHAADGVAAGLKFLNDKVFAQTDKLRETGPLGVVAADFIEAGLNAATGGGYGVARAISEAGEALINMGRNAETLRGDVDAAAIARAVGSFVSVGAGQVMGWTAQDAENLEDELKPIGDVADQGAHLHESKRHKQNIDAFNNKFQKIGANRLDENAKFKNKGGFNWGIEKGTGDIIGTRTFRGELQLNKDGKVAIPIEGGMKIRLNKDDPSKSQVDYQFKVAGQITPVTFTARAYGCEVNAGVKVELELKGSASSTLSQLGNASHKGLEGKLKFKPFAEVKVLGNSVYKADSTAHSINIF